ncbi:HAD family phosphatase [Salinisphaera sp.]|uniref:HAD family hydrolase n=1 Tax=Salinisphaera sp. TaxID=1914330 RepID=UPI002D78724E|nr:HAD family phosphatase [Salinisphaera sp.]HET7314783.1 HAD family phosphatase [Salinisphaera sp.]
MRPVLFFDLDGTLSDTHGLARATWLEVLRPHGIDVDFRFYKDNVRGRDKDDVVARLLPDLDADARRHLCEIEANSYRERTRRAAPLPGLTRFMVAGGELGWRMALVTNAPEADARASLAPLGLTDAFETMTFADEASALKPDPELYRLTLEKLNVNPEHGVAFEDSPRGVTAGVDAGLTVIGLVTTHHPAELRDAGAALVVGDFADPVLYDVLDDLGTLERCP